MLFRARVFFPYLACVCILTPGCYKNADKQWFGDYVFRLVSKTSCSFFEGFILIYPYWFCLKRCDVCWFRICLCIFHKTSHVPSDLPVQANPPFKMHATPPKKNKSLAFRNAVFCEEIGPSDLEKNTYFLKTYVTCKLSSMQHVHSEISSK